MPPSVVVCSPLPWGGLWTSRHALTAELARRGHRVLFVEPPGNRRRPSPVAERSAPDGVRVVRPPDRLPYGALRRIGTLHAAAIDRNARRYASFVAAEAAALPRPLVLVDSFVPVLAHRVPDALRPDVHVYHRADELRSFPTFHPRYAEIEARVARQADVVVAVSPAVRDGIADVRPDCAVLPNGVDVDRFAGARPDRALRSCTRPVAVLVGNVDHRADTSLLRAVAHAAGTFVVAGDADDGLLPRGAVRLGLVAPERIPGILAAADVAVVCHRRDYPGDALKVYEYLAAGVPVVAGDFPGLDNVRHAVRVVDGCGEMARAVVEEADARTHAGDEARRAEAARHTWSARADALLELTGVRAWA